MHELEILFGVNLVVLVCVMLFFLRYRRRIFRGRRVAALPRPPMSRSQAMASSILFSSSGPAAVATAPPVGSRRVQITLYKPQARAPPARSRSALANDLAPVLARR